MESKIKLACCEYSFGSIESWERAVDLVALLEFEGLNLCLMDVTEFVPLRESHLRLADLLADVPAAVRRVRAGVDAAGLDLASVHIVPPGEHAQIFHADPAARERSRDYYKKLVELTAELGAPTFTLPAAPAHAPGPDALQKAAEELAWRVAYATEAGATLTIEPDVGSVAETPQAALTLCQQIPDLKLTIDYSHFVYQGHALETIDPLLAHAGLLHGRGGKPGQLQARAEDDVIDWEGIVSQLVALDYSGYIAMEYVYLPDRPGHFNDLDNVDVVTETTQIRDRLRSAIAGHAPQPA